MKHLVISLCSILMMLLLTGFSVAQQTDAPAQDVAPPMEYPMDSMKAADQTTQASAPMQHKMMTATLEQMAAELGQENVTPETVKKIADQLKQLAEQHKKMSMMSGMDIKKGKKMGMMKDGKCKMMGEGQESKPLQMDMMSMMSMERDPKMMQMRGEMMKAMGEILMKYGQQMEAETPQPAPPEQPAPTDTQHQHHQ